MIQRKNTEQFTTGKMLKRAKIRVVTCVFRSTPRVLLLPAAGLVWLDTPCSCHFLVRTSVCVRALIMPFVFFFDPGTTTAGAGHHHHHLARRNADKIGKFHM